MSQELRNLFKSTADAIREKTGSSDSIKAKDFPQMIKNINVSNSGGNEAPNQKVRIEIASESSYENVYLGEMTVAKLSNSITTINQLKSCVLYVEDSNGISNTLNLSIDDFYGYESYTSIGVGWQQGCLYVQFVGDDYNSSGLYINFDTVRNYDSRYYITQGYIEFEYDEYGVKENEAAPEVPEYSNYFSFGSESEYEDYDFGEWLIEKISSSIPTYPDIYTGAIYCMASDESSTTFTFGTSTHSDSWFEGRYIKDDFSNTTLGVIVENNNAYRKKGVYLDFYQIQELWGKTIMSGNIEFRGVGV